MNSFLEQWAESAYTSLGFFWMALWAFILGYLISSFIQVFVTRKGMQKLMGKGEGRGILVGAIFGFISSSCSFAALATAKSLFRKGAGFMPSMAFLLASTNLVIELGIIISVFLGWQFVVGEYVGGVLLILFSWLFVRIIRPNRLIQEARNHLDHEESHDQGEENQRSEIFKAENWAKLGRKYAMEWQMVWKDVSIGFTVAGIVAVFVPQSFFESMFIDTATSGDDYSFFAILEHVLVGPLLAFLTFIGSMGNIPLAALLFGKGVSFAGVMAFIFSDLVVFPVLRIHSKYYGWKMSFFILFLLFASLIFTTLILHYSFDFLSILPEASDLNIREMEYFSLDYGFYLNILFLFLSALVLYLGFWKFKGQGHMHNMAHKGKILEKVLTQLATLSYLWLMGGMILRLLLSL